MNKKNLFVIAGLSLFILNMTQCTSQENPVDPYLGMWALDLDYEKDKAGWLEVRQEDGYLDAEILWRWASVYPVDSVKMESGELLLVHIHEEVLESDESGDPIKIMKQERRYTLKKEGEDRITGSGVIPNKNGIGAETVTFTGNRIPPCGKPPKLDEVKYGAPVQLLNGRDLAGWELLDPQAANGWRVEDGVLINDPVQPEKGEHINYGHLRTTETFEDFRLVVEVNIPEGSNGGVYLRGIYEVQVLDSYGKELDSHNMGALYSRIVPLVSAEKPAGEWQQLDIILYQRYLTVSLNGKTIIDNQPVKGVTGGALTSDEFHPGPIYLQGDHGAVSFRNLVLTPILN